MKLKSRDIMKAGGILLLILVSSALHYGTSIHHRYLHEIYQRVYYIPILLAAYWYGPAPGFLAAFTASVFYTYHIARDWSDVPSYALNQYVEIVLYHALGLLTGFLARNDRRHREKLEHATAALALAYDKLQRTFDRLKKADRLAALGQLSAGIAHEIRNPLGSIKGSIEILEGEIPETSPRRDFIRIIKEETARLNDIVGEFLKFARPPKPAKQPVSVNDLIDSTLILLQKEVRQSGISLTKQLDPALRPAYLDPDQIRQVLLNIILNGIQAMPAGGELAVRSGSCDKGTGIAIEISDTGTGVDEADLDRIFDPFFTTKPQGSGLGLAISYQLVANHGGKIVASRNPESGMTFRVELPRTPPSEPGSAA